MYLKLMVFGLPSKQERMSIEVGFEYFWATLIRSMQ